MDYKKKVGDRLHDILYRSTGTSYRKNDYVHAANVLLSMFDITDIDLICGFAKVIEENTTFDHELSNKDFTTIFIYFMRIVKDYQELIFTHHKEHGWDNNIGDHPSVGEELLEGIPEIEFKIMAIDECVIEEIFTFSEALEAYNVTEEEYFKFQMS